MSAATKAIICLLLVTETRSDEIWREGEVFEISVQSNGSYSVVVGGVSWLESSASLNALFAKGQWNKLQLKTTGRRKGSTPGMGVFSAVDLGFQTTGSDGAIPVVNTFKYYKDHDLFLFETVSAHD